MRQESMSDQAGTRTTGCTGDCSSPPRLQLYQTIIFATPVLFVFLLLLTFCLIYFRRRRSSRAVSIHSHIRAQLFEDGVFGNRCLQQGLSPSFRQRLPIVLFDDKFMATRGETQCAVCLGDYQSNEKLQQLPVCNHSFHVQCINEWLANNSTCPICRIGLDSSEVDRVLFPNEVHDARMWEERVVGEVQQQHHAVLHAISNASNGESRRDASSSEQRHVRCDGDYTMDIERS